MTKNAAEIKKLEEQLNKLKAEAVAFDNLTPDQKMAVALHDMLCRHNHTDGCGWYYEMKYGQHNEQVDDWDGPEHGVYMQKALMLRGFCRERSLTTETAIDLFTLIRGH